MPADAGPKAVVSCGDSAGDATRALSRSVCRRAGDYPIGLCEPAVWSRTSTAGCEPTSSCDGSWGRTT